MARMNKLARLAAAAAFVAAAGCGALEQKNNGDKYAAFSDPTVIGQFTRNVNTHYNDIARCQSALAGFVADAMLASVSGGEFAVINAGSVRFSPSLSLDDFIPAGPVTGTDVAQFLPFDNPSRTTPATIVLIDLSAAVIKQMFENGFSRMTADGKEGTSFGRFLQVSHTVRVQADVRQPTGQRVTAITLTDRDGGSVETIYPNGSGRTYRVAVPLKYIKNTPGFSDFDQYWNILAAGSNVVDTKARIYDAVVDTISARSPVTLVEVYPFTKPDVTSVTANCDNPSNRLVILHN